MEKKRKKKIVAILLTVSFIAAVFLGYFGLKTFKAYTKIRSNEGVDSLDEVAEDGRVNILIAGIDSGNFVGGKVRKDRGRTDTLMVASIDRETKQVNLLSIPRDTRVNIPNKGFEKVNHAHAYGGMDLTVRTVQNFLDIPIHHYVRVNFDAFIAMVDAVGTVTVEITPGELKGIINQDPNLKLTPGVQELDSEHAFQYVRIRNGDIGRVERQQKFIKALMKETLQLKNIWKSTKIMESVAEHLETDMSLGEMASLAKTVQGSKAEGLDTEILPGKGKYVDGVSYWIADEAKKDELVNRLFK